MQIHPDDTAKARLERAAKATGRTVEDLATSAVEEAALDWERREPGAGLAKAGVEHPMKAGIVQDDQPDLHRHPIHDAIERSDGGEK